MIHLHVWFPLSGRNINKGFHRGEPVLTCQDLEDADTKCGSQILFWWRCLLDWTRMWVPHMSCYLEWSSGDRREAPVSAWIGTEPFSIALAIHWHVSHYLPLVNPRAWHNNRAQNCGMIIFLLSFKSVLVAAHCQGTWLGWTRKMSWSPRNKALRGFRSHKEVICTSALTEGTPLLI